MLEHGGHLRAAAQHYQIPLESWIDLSTGINPNGWPVTQIPASCWQRLPENDDELLIAAQNYYGNVSLLPVAGSQAAIQLLPRLRPSSTVGIISPAYAEHGSSWRENGHAVLEIGISEIEANLAHLDVLILINPNNPTGQRFTRQQLLYYHQCLQQHQGWLIIDEAYIECALENSLSTYPVQDGLIILRSIGKFFGLAGIRCGFVITTPALLNRINKQLGPWAVSHPTRHVAISALQDKQWQQHTRANLATQALRLQQLLVENNLPPNGGCYLFQWIKTVRAKEIHTFLARRGILTRLIHHPDSLRLGLPKDEREWQKLEESISRLPVKITA